MDFACPEGRGCLGTASTGKGAMRQLPALGYTRFALSALRTAQIATVCSSASSTVRSVRVP